jgi:hypothetical protein
MNRRLKIILFVCSLVLLGVIRETTFININVELYNKYYKTTANKINPVLSFISMFSYKTLYIIKWALTPAFALFFLYLQRKFLWFLFAEKKPCRWLNVLYLSLFLLAVISQGIGWMINNMNEGYYFSRLFMGFLESPVPCMILIPAAYLYRHYEKISESLNKQAH